MTDNRNRRIAKNTIYLYLRMLLTMLVGLYTSRVILNVLGQSDFGLYNVVGGILTMFTMFSSSLQAGTNRFLTYALGERDIDKIKNTFSLAVTIHCIMALFLLVLAEIVGIYMLYNVLSIPEGRQTATFWVYQFAVFGFVLGIIQVPFQSTLIAHEHMNMYAYMSIYDVISKLAIVVLLQYVVFDKLIMFSFFVFLVGVSSLVIYNCYARYKFEECRFVFSWDKKKAKEMVSYCGWNLIGGSYNFFTNQGINILLNVFFNTIVNAARGISMQVIAMVSAFVNNFQVAVNPQIIKQYAAKEYNSLYNLVINNARIAEYLYLVIAIPLFIEIEFILDLWLGDYPEYTPIFIRLILIQTAEQPLNYPIGLLIHASGKMKWPSIWASVVILIFPLSYVVLSIGGSPISVYWISIVIMFSHNIINMYYANKYTGIPCRIVLKKVYANAILGGIPMFLVPYMVHTHMEIGGMRFFVVGLVSLLTSIIIVYSVGLTSGMREVLLGKVGLKKNK